MTYTEALSYINNQLQFGIKPGLERTRALLRALGDPHKKCEFVHVAGTNGKGSACAMIAAGLQATGKKTGLYTSPYIVDFRERMQINGRMIPKDRLAELTRKVKDAVDIINSPDEFTEFELITCIAFLWFSEEECDAVVLETGLGGRLDSTNVIEKPVCSCVTRIDYDHMAVLGDTIEQIAGLKAGIFKQGRPAIVSAAQYPAALEVLTKAADNTGSPLIIAHPAEKIDLSITGNKFNYDGREFDIKLAGEHQLANAAVAIEALRLMGVPWDAIREGLAKAFVPARLQVVSINPIVILDGAHNPNGAAALANAIGELLASDRPGRKIIGVMGICADKQTGEMVKILAPKFCKVYALGGFSERALPAEKLAEAASKYCPASPAAKLSDAITRAKAEAGSDGAVVICGSIYLAGEVLTAIH